MSEVDNLHAVAGRNGVHEAWFLTFTDPATGQGYWIRSTYQAPQAGPPSAGVWFARFDPADPASTFGLHLESSDWELAIDRFEVRIGDISLSSGRAHGSLDGAGHRVAWDLEFPTGAETYRLLPGLFYGGRLAPTKPFSPNPQIRLNGSITVDGETSEVAEARGQQGHIYGTRYAERWAWAQCGDFLGEKAVVHALTVQGKRGPFITPFVTSVGIRWRKRWIRLIKVRPNREFGLGTWRIDMENRRYRLTGRIEAPARALPMATYRDPDGSARYCHNLEIASCRLALFERRAGGFEEVALLESRGTTHAEWAGRTSAPGVERAFAEVVG